MVLEVLKNAVHVIQMLLKKDLMSQHPQLKPLQTLLEVLTVNQVTQEDGTYTQSTSSTVI